MLDNENRDFDIKAGYQVNEFLRSELGIKLVRFLDENIKTSISSLVESNPSESFKISECQSTIKNMQLIKSFFDQCIHESKLAYTNKESESGDFTF